MNGPLVSVIVPIYRAELYLNQCLDSIVTQRYTRLEIILVDDGSPDMSSSICEEYAGRDTRINVIHQEHRGVSRARNTGMDRAAGQLVTFVDADDWLEPKHIEILVNGIRNCECGICGYWIEKEKCSVPQKIGRARRFSKEMAMEKLLSPFAFQGYVCNKIFRLSIIREAGLRFREDITYMEDMLFCANYFRLCRVVFCTDQVTYHYRQHAGSTVGSICISEQWLRSRMTVFNALDGVRAVCCSPRAVRLCNAREQTECMEILLRLMKAKTMWDEISDLTGRVRAGVGRVLVSLLPVKMKVKYVFVALCPRLYCNVSRLLRKKED